MELCTRARTRHNFENLLKASMQPCFHGFIQFAFFTSYTASRIWPINLVKHDTVL